MKKNWLLAAVIAIVANHLTTHEAYAMGTSVLVELLQEDCASAGNIVQRVNNFKIAGFQLDDGYEPVCMKGSDNLDTRDTVIVHGWVDSDAVIQQLKAIPDIVNVWLDAPIAPMEKP